MPPDGDPRAMAVNGLDDARRNPALSDLPFTAHQLAEICVTPQMVPGS